MNNISKFIPKQCKSCKRWLSSEKEFFENTSGWRVCSEGNLWCKCSCKSLMSIEKGKHSWYTPENQMSKTARSVFNVLTNRDRFPLIPPITFEVQSLLQNPEVSSKDIVTTLKQDPLLALSIIELANCRSLRPIKDLEHALTFIGRQAVSNLVVVASIKTFRIRTQNYTHNHFWTESQNTGKLAEFLATELLKNNPVEKAFFAGVFCNIGKLIGSLHNPQCSDEIYTNTGSPKFLTWKESEKRSQAFPHQILGEIACTLWGLPQYVLEVVKTHHFMTNGKEVGIVDVAALANQMQHWINSDPYRIEEELLDYYTERLGLTDTKIHTLINQYQKTGQHTQL